MKRPPLKQGMKAGAAFAVFEVGAIVARHQERLRHPEQRPQAVRDVAWETSELALGNAARAGASVGALTALGLVPSTAVAGAAIAGSTAVTIGAPLAAGLAAGWVGSKVVRRTRHQLRLRGGTPDTTPAIGSSLARDQVSTALNTVQP